MWGLWWTKRHWGRFSPSTSVSPANHHSTNFSIIITTRSWHNRSIGGRSAEWTQMDSTPHHTNLNFFTRGLNVRQVFYFNFNVIQRSSSRTDRFPHVSQDGSFLITPTILRSAQRSAHGKARHWSFMEMHNVTEYT
jgi:hypothetical protein